MSYEAKSSWWIRTSPARWLEFGSLSPCSLPSASSTQWRTCSSSQLDCSQVRRGFLEGGLWWTIRIRVFTKNPGFVVSLIFFWTHFFLWSRYMHTFISESLLTSIGVIAFNWCLEALLWPGLTSLWRTWFQWPSAMLSPVHLCFVFKDSFLQQQSLVKQHPARFFSSALAMWISSGCGCWHVVLFWPIGKEGREEGRGRRWQVS